MHTFCFKRKISSSSLSFICGTVTMPLFNCSNSSFKQRISFWYFLISDFSSIICMLTAKVRKTIINLSYSANTFKSIPYFVLLVFQYVLLGVQTLMYYESLQYCLMKVSLCRLATFQREGRFSCSSNISHFCQLFHSIC